MKLQRTLGALAVVLTTLGCSPPRPRLSTDGIDRLRQTMHVGVPLNANLSYLLAGAGHRMIFIHGTPGSALGWVDYVREPLAGSQSMALDRPGFGASGPDQSVISLASQASAVVALLPTDGGKAVLVGHSLGGAVAAWVAAEHPDQVSALVLIAASLDPAQEKIHPLQPLGEMWPATALLPRAMRNANQELMGFKNGLELLAPRLSRITAPTVIVHGTMDALVPFANVAYMQEKLSGSSQVKTMVLEGGNHFLPWNAEATVREALSWALKAGA
jgi:pimeloyl-ACP methyl ester carboxylesterase